MPYFVLDIFLETKYKQNFFAKSHDKYTKRNHVLQEIHKAKKLETNVSILYEFKVSHDILAFLKAKAL